MLNLVPGTRVDRYEIEHVLGRGGMAVVVRARHVDLGSLHALKVLHIAVPGVVERMLQEGRLQATLDHTNIVGVRDVIRVRGMPCLVMEYIDGPPLDAVIHSLNRDQVDAIVTGLLRGIGAAHDQHLIHRDIKPHNIMLAIRDDEVVPKVTDFGLAKVLGDADNPLGRFRTRSGQLLGTPAYMAPEQTADAKHADHRADIFALGAVFYEMLCGEPPFGTDSLVNIFTRAAGGVYTPIEERIPDCPTGIASAIRQCLQANPDDRPNDTKAVAALWFEGRTPSSNAWSQADRQALYSTAAEVRDQEAQSDSNAPDVVSQTYDPVRATVDVQNTPLLPEERTEPNRKRPKVVGGLLLLVFGLALLVPTIGIGVGTTIWALSDPTQLPGEDAVVEDSSTTATSVDSEIIPSPSDQSAPSPRPIPAGTPSPTGPSPALVPVPQSVPSPSPSQAGTPSPAGPSPAPISPGNAALPVPTAQTDPTTAIVSVSGAGRAYLVDAAGNQYSVDAPIPASQYTLWVFFDDDIPTRVMRLSLSPGDHTTLSCSGAQRVCR